MSKSAGAMPDYQGAARETAGLGQANIDRQTAANRPNVNGPFGSTQWSKDAGGNWTVNQSLAPGLQDSANGMIAALRGGPVGGAMADSAYNYATSRLDPQFAQREQAERARLANQGLEPGGEAYGAEMRAFGQDRNDAYAGARNEAFDQGLRGFQANLGGLGGLYSLMQGPSFHAAGAAQGPDLLGAMGLQGQWQQSDADRQNQLWGDALGGLFSLGGSALGGFLGGKK